MKEPPSCSTFQVKARLYVNFIAVRKCNFLDSFLFCFVYKIFAVTILNIIPSCLSVMNVDTFEKKQFSLQFFFSLIQVTYMV